MKFVSDFSLVFVFVLWGSLVAISQSRSPESALEELATTDKIDVLARHLPLAIEENIARLNPADKAVMEKQIAVPHLLSRYGQTLRKRDDGLGWDFQFNPEASPQLVRVKSTFYSGGDALVMLETPNQDKALALVTMHYEDGEWRINDFGFVQMEGIATRLAEKLRPSATSEAVVVNTLTSIDSALAQYASNYPETGFPSRLQALGPDPDAPKGPLDSDSANPPADSDSNQEQSEDSQRPPADHAGLLDASYVADPLIIEGYRLRYTLIASASSDDQGRSPGRFSITASPVELGKTGTRSYYIDENGLVRFTDQERDATANDPPVPISGGYHLHDWLH